MRIGHRRHHRAGLTLIEMMIVVVIVILMMLAIGTIFQSSTGAITGLRQGQQLDHDVKIVDSTIRRDLAGATARMTPPLDPKDNLGYFEYGENQVADAQGEDSDDYLAFTAKAPEGLPFTGRVMLPVLDGNNNRCQPVTITSDYAEIIYFQRGDKLYRRVLLIRPDLAGRLLTSGSFVPGENMPAGQFRLAMFGPAVAVGWQGANDISAHPSPIDSPDLAPRPNTLGDLTERHNRFARPTHADSYDGNSVPDDVNGDGLPDYYPTIYARLRNVSVDALGFPFIFPGAFSEPYGDPGTRGIIHGMYSLDAFDNFNHAPVELGDSLALPPGRQTWWGFPTWRETLSVNWAAPMFRLNAGGDINAAVQAPGLARANLAAPTVWLPPQTESDQPYSNPNAGSPAFLPPVEVWEDDLLMSGVRSFDVKAYDDETTILNEPLIPRGYYDLGYLKRGLNAPGNAIRTMGHEGRVPPLTTDFILHPRWPYQNDGVTPNNLGDDNPILRMTRVWDTWSTTYMNAPDGQINPLLSPPINGGVPVYPSYPPPYIQPLRGIQVQIRVVDPSNKKVKILTIRHDFSDKL